LHARVGYAEGPQVADPRAPEWQEALNNHLQWWDKVVYRISNQTGDNLVTISPEFGPHPYMVHLPGTSTPIANQWDVNLFMMELLKERYSH